MTRPLVPTRPLVLCADDFGLSAPISSGIDTLARRARLSAVACITNAPHWREAAGLLRQWPASVSSGVHLNLTEGEPASTELRALWPVLPSLQRLLVQSQLRLLPRAALRAEVAAQIEAFRAVAGRAPDFIDGHQHVHGLPGVREGLLDQVGTMAVRSTAHVLGPAAGLKGRVIETSGGRALGAALQAAGIVHNPVLLGAYDFQAIDYRTLMQQWLRLMPADGALLFCHPGHAAPGDAIGAARERELGYFDSPGFDADLAEAQVVLVPFSGRSRSG